MPLAAANFPAPEFEVVRESDHKDLALVSCSAPASAAAGKAADGLDHV
jgi:hypothetical protein